MFFLNHVQLIFWCFYGVPYYTSVILCCKYKFTDKSHIFFTCIWQLSPLEIKTKLEIEHTCSWKYQNYKTDKVVLVRSEGGLLLVWIQSCCIHNKTAFLVPIDLSLHERNKCVQVMIYLGNRNFHTAYNTIYLDKWLQLGIHPAYLCRRYIWQPPWCLASVHHKGDGIEVPERGKCFISWLFSVCSKNIKVLLVNKNVTSRHVWFYIFKSLLFGLPLYNIY